MALNLSKLMKQKGAPPAPALGAGLPSGMGDMMSQQAAPPNAPGMGALMGKPAAAPKRKSKPKRKGGKGY